MSRDEARVFVAESKGWKKREDLSSCWNNVWELNGVIQDNPPPLYTEEVNGILEKAGKK